MKRVKFILPAILALALTGAACSKTATTANSNAAANVNAAQTYAVSYAGQDGKTALELLQAGHQVDVSDEGFVNAIDGTTPGDHQFWAFYVNNAPASVGAKDYQTKNSDQIGWKLESF